MPRCPAEIKGSEPAVSPYVSAEAAETPVIGNVRRSRRIMITRVFRVRIQPGLRSEFERKFMEISVPHVQTQRGYLSHVVGYPTKWKPDEYLLLTNWRDEKTLIDFAGEDWNKPVIPSGMEKFVAECWVDHFKTK
jgi:heme oxygenase (mycobilin-producing)